MIKYADGGELQDSDLRDIVLKSFKDEEGFDLGYESGRSYRYKSEDHTAKKSVNYNGEDYTVEFRVKVMYEAEGAATIEELTVDGIDVDLELFSEEDREEVENFFDDMSENIGQDNYAKGGKVQKRPRFDNLMADGGEVKWQDARIGDSARVKSENKMGLILKDYGRKFHLKFVDGTEKTYDASELEFIKDEYPDGELEWGEDLGDGFSVGNDVIITASGKTGYISGLSGKDLLVTIYEDGEDMNVVVSKRGVKMLDAPEYAKGGKMASYMAKGGMVVTSIKDIPNFKQRLDEGKITYRGLGLGKLWDDFNKLTGSSGTRIKVDGKEYFITDDEFNTFSRGADGKMRIRFDAPFKKSYEDGGYMAKGGELEKIKNEYSKLYPKFRWELKKESKTNYSPSSDIIYFETDKLYPKRFIQIENYSGYRDDISKKFGQYKLNIYLHPILEIYGEDTADENPTISKYFREYPTESEIKKELGKKESSWFTKIANGDYMAKGGKVQKRPRFDNLMADGGVTYVAPNDYDQKYFRRFDKAIGSFAWIYNKKYNEGILYPLTDFDKDYYSHIKLKDGEVLLRYKTDRMMSKYLIKFNLDKSLIYFLVDGDDDKNPTFESRGIKADYIVVTNNYKK
jgi:hypothetical protein